jgi:multisubunit Na+/H+ antiporter MnhC subunit
LKGASITATSGYCYLISSSWTFFVIGATDLISWIIGLSLGSSAINLSLLPSSMESLSSSSGSYLNLIPPDDVAGSGAYYLLAPSSL